jgi:hypothetical protein
VKADPRFIKQTNAFWAHIRTISEEIGYSERGKGQVKVPTLAAVVQALRHLGLKTDHVADAAGRPTAFGTLLINYFDYRAEALHKCAQPNLMGVAQAKKVFEKLKAQYKPNKADIPWNKQKKEKKAPAYLTAIVGMIIRAHAGGMQFNLDPQSLTTVTKDGRPLRTLARRVDGAFPSIVNPIAVWEIKEYYYTTTYGSRVNDGIYESLLDGLEIEELREHEHIDVKHYFILDAHNTLWNMGRPLLCRSVDMLHMGYVDEVLFGAEVVERLPLIVKEWVQIAKQREARGKGAATPPGEKPAGAGREPKHARS